MDEGDRFFLSFDGTPIRYRFRAPRRPDASRLIIIHGAQEHSGRYDELSAFLAARGFGVYAADLRGYGRSGGARAFIRSFEDYLQDLNALVNKTLRDGTGPLYLLGHSLGGLIAATAAADAAIGVRLQGLILSSPCFRLAFRVPLHERVLSRVLTVIWPTFLHRTRLAPEILTHDREVVEAYRRDPLVVPAVSARLFFHMTRKMADYARIAAQIRCRVLILQAGEDRTVDAAATRSFFAAIPGTKKDLRVYDGLYHEVLQELSRRSIFNEIALWIDR